MRPSLLSVSLALCLSSSIAAASGAPDAAPSTDAADFDRVVVTATRTERAIADVPNTVDVIERARMDTLLVRDLVDLFRYEPGITVGNTFGRFGLNDIRIRGLGGNRVRIQTDGIPVSDAFAIGSFSNANRNFVDLDTLKRVEIVRGPGSALYGSDALGGVVAFITKDPSDYLADGGHVHFGTKLGFESANEGLFAGATAAFGGQRWSGLVAFGHRQGKETENMGEVGGSGAARTQANPQSSNGRSLLAKLLFEPDARQRFRLTVEGNEDATDTDVLTALGDVVMQPGRPPTARVHAQRGQDHQTRARMSFGHEIDGLDGIVDAIAWQVYRQDSETTQRTTERRATLAGGAETSPTLRERTFNFDQRSYGLQADFRTSFGDAVVHGLAWGLDLSRTDTRQKRDGRATHLITGAVTNVILPDTFPVRDFPISETTKAALYLQDEIVFADGRFRVVPAVRLDHYRLAPEVDAIFREDNPATEVARIEETRVSPKLGMVWRFAQDWSLFGGYAAGFRAPPYNDVNIGFTNVLFGYTAIPNPDLRPETSDGLELGLRFLGDAAWASLAAHYTEYDDFIESQRFVGVDPVTRLQVFQSQNIQDARIRGIEFKGGLRFGAWTDALDGWSLRGAAAWSEGEDRTTGAALASVDPLTATLGLAFDREAWGAELAGRAVARRDRMPPSPSAANGAPGTPYFESPGHALLDLYAHWTFAPGARLDAGVFNLADRKVWQTGLVPLVAETSAVLDRYTAPGRNLAVSLSVDF